jgi:hypothetical protein
MLYIIGGASRSGKTLLSRRAVVERQIPYFPLDALFGALARGVPQLGVAYENTLMERPHKMWPVAQHMFSFFLEEEKNFLIEGDSILPSQIDELLKQGKQIRCCFLGYTALTKDEKLALVRKHNQGETDWTRGISDEEMLKMVDEMIQFSKYLKDECAKYGLAYFDVSHDFEGVRAKAFEYLFEK